MSASPDGGRSPALATALAGERAPAHPAGTVEEPTAPVPAGDLQLALTTDKTTYAAGEPVTLTLTVTNPRPTPVALAFASSQQYDFEVRLGERSLWRWSADWAFAQMLTRRVLGPGERWVVFETWDGRDDQGQRPAPGTYEIVARLTSRKDPLTVCLPLHIGG
jgi:hypothetical protein